SARRFVLELEQHCPPSPGQAIKSPFHIPLAIGLVGPDGRDCELHVAEERDGRLLAAAARPDRDAHGHTAVLDLTGSRHVFVFDDIADPPIPSLLRNFSAPVVIEFDYDDAQLAFLAAHDSDPFNRWEAAQRLAVNGVLAIVAGADPAQRSAPLADALRGLLEDPSLDPAFRDQLFVLPSEGFIAEQLSVVDPTALRSARNALRRGVAEALTAQWAPSYAALRDDGPYSPEPAAAGRRALKNTVLAWWVETQAPEAIPAAEAQLPR